MKKPINNNGVYTPPTSEVLRIRLNSLICASVDESVSNVQIEDFNFENNEYAW